MLFFRSEEQLDQWLAAKQVKRGVVLSIPRLWHLSQRWYRDRTSPDFRGRTVEQVQQIFEDEGLTTEYWQAR